MSRESRLSFKNQGALPQTLQALVWSELCFAKWLRHRIYLCGSLVRTLLRKVATPPHLSLRFTGQNFASQSGYTTASYSELCFAKRSATAASWSKHFATQNGLLSKFCYAKPPTASAVFAVFDHPVFFGVHTLRFIKGLT